MGTAYKGHVFIIQSCAYTCCVLLLPKLGDKSHEDTSLGSSGGEESSHTEDE